VYVVAQTLPTVYELGLQLFRDITARAPRIKDRLLKILLDLVYRERLGEVVNRSLLKSITQMLVDLGVNSRMVYDEDFERAFLETSANFYRFESQEFIDSNSCADYLKKVLLSLLCLSACLIVLAGGSALEGGA
jgi:cullin 3